MSREWDDFIENQFTSILDEYQKARIKNLRSMPYEYQKKILIQEKSIDLLTSEI